MNTLVPSQAIDPIKEKILAAHVREGRLDLACGLLDLQVTSKFDALIAINRIARAQDLQELMNAVVPIMSEEAALGMIEETSPLPQ